MKAVKQDSLDRLSYRLVLPNFSEATLTGASLAIFSPGGQELRADSAASVAVSGSLATFSPASAWDVTSYPVARNYRAVWTLTTSAGSVVREDRFDVTLRDFVSEVVDADLAEMERGVTAAAGIAGLAVFRKNAWDEISRHVAATLRENPSVVAIPSSFRLAHIYLALSMFYRSERFGTLGAESEAAWKAGHYEGEYRRALALALNDLSLDTTNDNQIDQPRRPISRVRFVR